METTFIIAKQFGVTPFEIMAQDIDKVILVINYIIESSRGGASNNGVNNTLSEKEQDKGFWECL